VLAHTFKLYSELEYETNPCGIQNTVQDLNNVCCGGLLLQANHVKVALRVDERTFGMLEVCRFSRKIIFVSIITELRGGRPWLNSRQGQGFFSPLHRVQTGSGVHSASYPMGAGGSYPGGKAAVAWSWPHLHPVPRLRMRVAIPPFLHIFAWRGT
jgi:hypothetical protein